MSLRSTFNIDSMKIASPCPAKWSDMKGDDRVRVCGDCSMQVFNTAELSKREIEELVTNRSGKRLCNRLHRRPDGTVITKNCPVGFRAAAQRATRFAGVAFSLILGLITVGFGQQKMTASPASLALVSRSTTNKIILEGTVTDPTGAVVPGAQIRVYSYSGNRKKKIARIESDKVGGFKIFLQRPGQYLLKVKAAGFNTTSVDHLELSAGETKAVTIVLDVEVYVEVGIFLTEPLIDVTSSEISTTIKADPF
jgi:hypothetical protein